MGHRLAMHLLLALALLGSALVSTAHVAEHAAADALRVAHAALHPGHAAGAHGLDLRTGARGAPVPEGLDERAGCLGHHLFCGAQGGVAAPISMASARLRAGTAVAVAVPAGPGAPDPVAPPIRAPPARS